MAFSDQDIDELLIRVFRGHASVQDYEYLKNWVEENRQNRRYFNQVRNIWQASAGMEVSPEEMSLALKKYQSYIRNSKKARIRKIYGEVAVYAAALVLFIGISYFLFKQGENDSVNPVRSQENYSLAEKIKSSHVELKRGDGTLVNLSDTLRELEKEIDGTRLNRKGERTLEYKAETIPVKEDIVYNKLSVPAGERFQLTLSDGTKVWLNSETVLSYPTRFSGERREIRLVGQAYFQVAKDEEHPFVVITDKMAVEALGTGFEVTFYEEDKEVFMTLVEGAVRVSAGKQMLVVEPDHQVVMDYVTGEMSVKIVDAKESILWKEGVLVLKKLTFVQMLHKLERWYGVSFFNMAKVDGKELFNGKFDREDLITALETVKKSSEVNYMVKGKAVTLFN